tara:strand:+ start:1547 stop:2077 length:531 start_codon:yes stop_codon:yes gene_type:complete
MKRNSKLRQRKQEITLMTLLANESSKESAGILAKYKIPKAKDHGDLEVKLAKLYFHPKTDKLQIEKELAEIHPHKKWIVKALKLKSTEDIDKLEKELLESAKKSQEEIDKSKEAKCVDDNCEIHGSNSKTSNFSGNENTQVSGSEKKLTNSMEVIGLVGIVGLLGITLILVSKNLK